MKISISGRHVIQSPAKIAPGSRGAGRHKPDPVRDHLNRLEALVAEAAKALVDAETFGGEVWWRKVYVSATAAGERWLALPEPVRADLRKDGWASAPAPDDDPAGGMIVAVWLVAGMRERGRR